nr:MAG TPA: hypothetical protein [Inoviridae sp.]
MLLRHIRFFSGKIRLSLSFIFHDFRRPHATAGRLKSLYPP